MEAAGEHEFKNASTKLHIIIKSLIWKKLGLMLHYAKRLFEKIVVQYVNDIIKQYIKKSGG